MNFGFVLTNRGERANTLILVFCFVATLGCAQGLYLALSSESQGLRDPARSDTCRANALLTVLSLALVVFLYVQLTFLSLFLLWMFVWISSAYNYALWLGFLKGRETSFFRGMKIVRKSLDLFYFSELLFLWIKYA